MTIADDPETTTRPFEFEFVGRGRSLAGLAARNGALNVTSLFLYRFWARSDVRRALWSRIVIGGDPLEYTGRPLELFLGAVFIAAIILIPLALASFIVEIARAMWDAPYLILWGPFVYILLRALVGAAVFRARRYRLRRTVWRGLRFDQTGSSWPYAFKSLGLFVLSTITLGWTLPLRRKVLARHLWSRTWLSGTPFRFEPEPGSGSLYSNYAVGWFGLVGFSVVGTVVFGIIIVALSVAMTSVAGGEDVTVGLVLAATAAFYLLFGLFAQWIFSFYEAAVLRWVASGVKLGDAAFALDLKGGEFAALRVTNMLVMIFTLGLGLPIAQARRVRLITSRLRVVGTVDASAVVRGDGVDGDGGEGLADAFDLGAI